MSLIFLNEKSTKIKRCELCILICLYITCTNIAYTNVNSSYTVRIYQLICVCVCVHLFLSKNQPVNLKICVSSDSELKIRQNILGTMTKFLRTCSLTITVHTDLVILSTKPLLLLYFTSVNTAMTFTVRNCTTISTLLLIGMSQ